MTMTLNAFTLRELESILRMQYAVGPMLHACPLCGEPSRRATDPCHVCVLTELERRFGPDAAERMEASVILSKKYQ